MNRRRRLLLFVICLAIGLHLALIYSLNDLPLEFQGRNFRLDEQLATPLKEISEDEINRQLAHIFRDFSQHAISSNLITPNAPLADATPPALELHALDSLSFDEELSSFQLTNQDLPKDPLQALVEGLLGNVDVALPELFHDDISIRVGTSDLGSLNGPAEKANPLSNHAHKEASGAIANSNDFEVTLEYAPKTDGRGLSFRVTLTPKSTVQFRTIAQNVVFLIDRSHSIDQDRYSTSKIAVLHAIQSLRPQDRFNILVFDDRVTAFASQMIPRNSYNIEMARQFLQSQPYGGIFASTDLYSSLGNIIPDIVEPTEVNAAILLSDGDTFLSKDKQRRSIASWTEHNEGKVALFCVTAGSDNNLPLLDFLAAENKGMLIHAQTSVSEALARLMEQICQPIAKDIIASAVSRSPGVALALYPPSNRQAHLYQRKPYVLYGTLDNPADFYLFLQGKYYDDWLDIRQLITFQQGTQVAASELEQALAQQQAYDHYEDYLRNGNHASLTQARKLLHAHNISAAFQ